jgi:hypothetical protein
VDSAKIEDVVKRQLPILEPAIFFAVFFLYVWLVIEPRLIYYAFGRVLPYPLFLIDGRFLFQSLTAAGGPIACLTGFLSQCFYFSWLGALVLTAIGWLFWLLLTKILSITKAHYLSWVSYLIPVLMLITYTRYDDQLLKILSFLAVLSVFVLYIKADIQKNIFAVLLFLTGFVLLCYIAADVVILFGLLAGLYESFIKGRKTLAAAILIFPVVYYIWTRFFNFPNMSSFSIIDMQPNSIINLLPLLILLVLLEIAFHKYILKALLKITLLLPVTQRGILPYRNVAKLKAIFPIVLIFFAFCISYKRFPKVFLEMGYYSDKREWQKVIELAQAYPSCLSNILCNHDLDLALYHTGQLGSKMFSYPQDPHVLLISQPGLLLTPTAFSRKVDIFLELGNLGDAERFACETLEVTDQCPYIIKRLALINLAKKRYEAARVYLNALSKDLIYGHFASQLLRRLDTDPQLNSYEPVQYLRSIAIETDNTSAYKPDDLFTQALQKNPKNKMAFEYMMAFYLAAGQVDKIAENIHRLKDFSYEKMPDHYGEALMIYTTLSKAKGYKQVDLSNFSPAPQTIERFKKFEEEVNALRAKGCDRQVARNALAKNYGDSYMFYLSFEFRGEEK